MKRVAKFQEGGGVRGPSRDISEMSDQELAALIRAEETAQTPYMERTVTPRINIGPRFRVNPATGAYTLADLRNEQRRRLPASRRYAPFEGQPGSEVTEEEMQTRPAERPRASAPASMPLVNQGPPAAGVVGRAANQAPTPRPAATGRGYYQGEGTEETALQDRVQAMGRRLEEDAARAAAARPAATARPRPAQRQAPRPRQMSAEEQHAFMVRTMQEEADREAAARQARPGFFERMGIRRTNETGEGAPSTGSLRGDLQALGRSLGFKKGGAIKGKGMHMMPDGSMMKNEDHAAMKKGNKAMMYREGGKVRQGMQSPKAQEARAEMAEDVMKRSMPAEPKRRMRDMMSPGDRREYDAPLTAQERERMRESGFKKGGMIKPKAKTAMKKGGAVKAPAKKMAHGGKVHGPKKMMKGGMTSKPKKMMDGGRAMYAKGGMAKGCK